MSTQLSEAETIKLRDVTRSRWTVLWELDVRNGKRFCLARCECGTRREVNLNNILTGRSLSCGCLKPSGRPRVPLADRFWPKVDKRSDNDCWPFLGYRNQYGYGIFWDTENNRNVGAHRVAYESLVGRIPDDLTIDHLCLCRHCVNPGHMEPVTREENSRRATQWVYQDGVAVQCAKGHDLTLANALTHRPDGGRQCSVCKRETRGRRHV